MVLEYTLQSILLILVGMLMHRHLETGICIWLEYLLVTMLRDTPVTKHHQKKQEAARLMHMTRLSTIQLIQEYL